MLQTNKRPLLCSQIRIYRSCVLGLVLLARTGWAQVPDYDAVLSSTQWPVQVFYPNSVAESKAQEALSYAEAAWQVQIQDMGFTPPWLQLPDNSLEEGLAVYLNPGGLSNHIATFGSFDNGPGCVALVDIPSFQNSDFLQMFVAYGLNVASEYAAHCGATYSNYQQTGVAVTVLRWPNDSTFIVKALPTFQNYPYKGLDCTFVDSQERYFYSAGAALFLVFLEEQYGVYDGTLLADIWQHMATQQAEQEAPNLFADLAAVLAPVTVEQAFVEFSRWRYFVGARDDGLHFRHGALWLGSELAMDAEYGAQDLPLEQVAPQFAPNAYGASYTSLGVSGIADKQQLIIDFVGDAQAHWQAEVLVVGAAKSATVHAFELETETGQLTLGAAALAGAQNVVLVVTQFGSAEHNSQQADCSNGLNYHFSMRWQAEPDQTDETKPTPSGPCALLTPAEVWPAGFVLALLVFWRRRRKYCSAEVSLRQTASGASCQICHSTK